MKAPEIIAEIKNLSPKEYAEVSAFMLRAERNDPDFQVAIQRKHESAKGRSPSRPYEEVRASALASLPRQE